MFAPELLLRFLERTPRQPFFQGWRQACQPPEQPPPARHNDDGIIAGDGIENLAGKYIRGHGFQRLPLASLVGQGNIFQLLAILAATLKQRRTDDPWTKDAYPYPRAPCFGAQRPREADNGELGGPVADGARAALQPNHRCGVDDVPVSLSHHQRVGDLNAVHNPA